MTTRRTTTVPPRPRTGPSAPDGGYGARMRRLLSFTLALAALAGTAACSSSGSGGSSGATTGGGGSSGSTAPGSTGGPGATGSTGGSGLRLTSSAFADGAAIPKDNTCQGAGTSPELSWTGAPSGTAAFALVVNDPDAPVAGGFTHWVLYSIPADTSSIPAGGTAGSPGLNGAGKPGWTPPCPPSGTHHYVFTLYALPTVTAFAETPTKAQVEALGKDALATTTLTGTYARS